MLDTKLGIIFQIKTDNTCFSFKQARFKLKTF